MDSKQFVKDINDTGFTVQQNAFDPEKIRELDQFAATVTPERGHLLTDRKWMGWDAVEQLEDPFNDVDWAYYWTKQIYGNDIIENHIKPRLAECANAAFGEDNWEWHVTDFIVLYPGMNWVRPHIDTPYRFNEFKNDKELLGLQFMVMMCDFNENNGATGYVPGTHKYIIDSDSIFKNDVFCDFFLDNYKQYTAPTGSFVCWHPRLLHSTMPNRTNKIRRALLLHAAEKKTARLLNIIDPTVNQSLRNT